MGETPERPLFLEEEKMPTKVEKNIILTVSGGDVEKLRSLLDCSRIYLNEHKNDLYAGGGNDRETRRMLSAYLSELFDYTA